MFLQKKKNISNTTRNKFLPNYLPNSFNKFFFFFFLKKNSQIGQNQKGQKVLFSKKKSSAIFLKFNKYISWNKQTALIIDFKQILYKNLFFLIKYFNGSITLIKSIFGLFIGDFLNFFFFFFKNVFFFI